MTEEKKEKTSEGGKMTANEFINLKLQKKSLPERLSGEHFSFVATSFYFLDLWAEGGKLPFGVDEREFIDNMQDRIRSYYWYVIEDYLENSNVRHLFDNYIRGQENVIVPNYGSVHWRQALESQQEWVDNLFERYFITCTNRETVMEIAGCYLKYVNSYRNFVSKNATYEEANAQKKEADAFSHLVL